MFLIDRSAGPGHPPGNMSQELTTLVIFDAKNIKYVGKLLVRPMAPNEVFYIFLYFILFIFYNALVTLLSCKRLYAINL